MISHENVNIQPVSLQYLYVKTANQQLALKQHFHTQFLTPLTSLWQSITVRHRQELAVNKKNKKQKPDTYPELKTCMLWALEFMPTAKYNPMSSAYMKLYSWLYRSLTSQSEANEAEHRLHNNRS